MQPLPLSDQLDASCTGHIEPLHLLALQVLKYQLFPSQGTCLVHGLQQASMTSIKCYLYTFCWVPGHYLVRFYGDHSSTWVADKEISSLTDGYKYRLESLQAWAKKMSK